MGREKAQKRQRSLAHGLRPPAEALPQLRGSTVEDTRVRSALADAGILHKHVLGRLAISDLQALRATQAALRSAITPADVYSRAKATLPAGHPLRGAPAEGFMDQLRALAAQHAAIRQDKRKLVRYAALDNSLLDPWFEIYPERSLMSPSGLCVATAYIVEIFAGTQFAFPAGNSADAAWAVMPRRGLGEGEELEEPTTLGTLAWSPSGRYFASLHQNNPEMDKQGVSFQLFDAQSREWLPEVLIDPRYECGSVSRSSRISFASDSTLAAVRYDHILDTLPCAILVFAVGQAKPTFRVAPAKGLLDYCWLPDGSHTLLLLGKGRIARLDMDTAPPLGLLKPSWVKAPATAAAERACLAVMPGAAAAVVLVLKPRPAGRVQACVTMYDCASLACTGAWEQGITLQAGSTEVRHFSLAAGCGVVAASFGSSATASHGIWVWGLEGSESSLRFSVGALHSCSFSPCGAWLAGIIGDKSHVLLDAKDGECMLELPTLHISDTLPAVKPLSIAWAGPGCSQLHIGSAQEDGGEDSQALSALMYRIFEFA